MLFLVVKVAFLFKTFGFWGAWVGQWVKMLGFIRIQLFFLTAKCSSILFSTTLTY